MPNDMLVLVPAAGESRRFKEAGIDKPKGLILFQHEKLDGFDRVMVEHVLQDFPRATIAVSAVTPEWQNFGRGRRVRDIIEVGSTLGQADTVKKALRAIDSVKLETPVLVLNSDCGFLYPLKAFVAQAREFDSAVLVFDGLGETAFSYIDNFPIFKTAAEKFPISKWAIAGAFYFRRAAALMLALEQQQRGGPCHSNGEFYLSGTFRHLEGTHLAVAMLREQLLSWGTPEDLARDRDIHIENEVNEKLQRFR